MNRLCRQTMHREATFLEAQPSSSKLACASLTVLLIHNDIVDSLKDFTAFFQSLQEGTSLVCFQEESVQAQLSLEVCGWHLTLIK